MAILTADSNVVFRRYNGVEILIEMLMVHKDVQIVKALLHVLNKKGKQKIAIQPLSFITFLLLEPLVNKRKNEVGDVIGEILCREPSSDEETVEIFVDLLSFFGPTFDQTAQMQNLLRGICVGLKKYASNENITLKLMEALDKNLSDEECKSDIYFKAQTHVSSKNLWRSRVN